jgi:hypothetical protein
MPDFDFCKFKNIFGSPGEGARAYRFMGVAIIDVVAAVCISMIISRIMKWSVWSVLISFFITGIVVHRIFCVRTTIDKLLFPH